MSTTTETTNSARPYVVLDKSAHMPNSCRGTYRRLAVVETDGKTVPIMISERAAGFVRLVRYWEALNVGETERCAYRRGLREATALAEHLNVMHQVRRGTRRITVRNIDEQDNAELQRELIEAYTGLTAATAHLAGMDAFLADAGAETVSVDDTGRLIRRETVAGPILAVQVTCPSTGREYVLRVPPAIETARAGVAWTFGLTAEQYQPTIQS